MRWLLTLAISSGLGVGYWQWQKGNFDPKKLLDKVLHQEGFPTLEVRYSSAHIMEANRRDLIKDARHKYLDPELMFYPYLLLEVKFTLREKTKEGILLWDMVDGEMVIDTKDWQKTHGFGDCIKAVADKNEFKLLKLLARKGGYSDRESLLSALSVENDILETWIDSCRKKKLIVLNGNKYRLHIEKPTLEALPETRIEERLVTKSLNNALRAPKRFSSSQIERMCKAAFGNDFVIRKNSLIFLPVHSIVVQNPDGSVHTTHWNALNGRRLNPGTY
jgi:hypothetical protein